ncbi:MAG: hypothetical protein VZS44_07485 [Bacilli bacterium]|nr:hypothetical protein [Bacilli bacterium]
MVTRNKVLSRAVDDCMKELYSFVQPSVSWDKFMEENEIYSKIYKEHEQYRKAYYDRKKYPEVWEKVKSQYEVLEWDPNKSYKECIGPAPFEFYYLPKEIMKDICDSYIYAYKIDSQQELLNTISILKEYCRKPIVDKYIEEHTDEYGNWHPGYRSYDNPNNLEEEVQKIFDNEILPDICKQYNKQYDLQTTGIESSVSKAYSQIFQNKFFEFLDMAGNFYNWTRDLNAFNMSVYLGASPCSNKDAVIENWKKYKNQDIKIDEKQIEKEYYGEEDFDE